MLTDRLRSDRSAPQTAPGVPRKEPDDTTGRPPAPAGQYGPESTVMGPLSNLPANAQALAQTAESTQRADAGGPRSRVRRWAANIAGLFGPSAAAAGSSTAALRQWRPTHPAFQHFHELVDSIGKAPDGARAAIANAMEARLRDAGLMLPLHQHSADHTVATLLSSGWFDAVCDQPMNISELLSALRRSDEVEPDLQPELRRRLVTSFEVVVDRLAENHAGVSALRASCAAELRPMRDTPSRQPDAGSRMRAFSASARQLANEPGMRNATAGSLAARLFDCLRQNRNWSEEEEISLGEQIAPTLETIIRTDPAARRMAGPLREAGRRLENHLNIRACLDMTEPKKRGTGPTPIEKMEPRSARGLLFSGLLRCALDPAVLNASLRNGAMHDWLHPLVADQPGHQNDGQAILQVLRQTLRPMLDTGLIDHDQRHALMQQMEDHLQHE